MKFFHRMIGTGTPFLELAVWEDLTQEDNAPALDMIGLGCTVQVTGDAAGVEILGLVHGSEFAQLNDSDTLPLAFSFSGLKTSVDMFQAIKPRKAGAGKATVSIIIRRN